MWVFHFISVISPEGLFLIVVLYETPSSWANPKPKHLWYDLCLFVFSTAKVFITCEWTPWNVVILELTKWSSQMCLIYVPASSLIVTTMPSHMISSMIFALWIRHFAINQKEPIYPTCLYYVRALSLNSDHLDLFSDSLDDLYWSLEKTIKMFLSKSTCFIWWFEFLHQSTFFSLQSMVSLDVCFGSLSCMKPRCHRLSDILPSRSLHWLPVSQYWQSRRLSGWILVAVFGLCCYTAWELLVLLLFALGYSESVYSVQVPVSPFSPSLIVIFLKSL